MHDAIRVLMVLSPVLWLLLSVVIHDYLAARDDEADAVVPAMSAAFLVVLALWAAFFLLVHPHTGGTRPQDANLAITFPPQTLAPLPKRDEVNFTC